MLKYLNRHPVARLTIAGGFGKLAKLAQGNLDLRAVRCAVDLDKLVATLAQFGADGAEIDAALAVTVPLADPN